MSSEKKPRKWKKWEDVPNGVLVRTESKFAEREYYLKIGNLEICRVSNGWAEFGGWNPDDFAVKKYKEVLL